MASVRAIAVIIPAYNQAPFLAEAVDSVYAQSLLPQQVIVVDDGSTDQTGKVLDALQKKYPQLTVIRQANTGVAKACQQALERVTTPLVVRLDADDSMPKNYLESLLTCLENSEAAFAYCDAQYFGSREGRITARPWSVWHLVRENYIHVSSLIRTDIVRELGYYSPTMKFGFEDWDFYLALAEAGYKGVYCPDTALKYRQHDRGGRNNMDKTKDLTMRAQIQQNHPRLFRRPWYQLAIFLWRAKRKMKHLVS